MSIRLPHSQQAPSHQYQRSHQRSRTWSLYSTSSSAASSSYSNWNPTALPAPKPTAGEHKSEQAWGAFVPMTSAAASCLRYVVSDIAPTPSYTDRAKNMGTRPQNGPSCEKRIGAVSASNRLKFPSSSLSPLEIPVIVRTGTEFSPTSSSSSSSSLSGLASPSEFSPVSDIDASSPIRYLLPTPQQTKNATALHPVLARLERSSKFCTNKVSCATCKKPGRDFPACAKCQKMWCSRECRLAGGKRHVC